MILSIISAVAKNNEIGQKNALLWSLPADLKHFKEITTGHPVIMGQKTFESLGRSPNGELGRPLPNRRNIVLTKDNNFKHEGVEIVYSIEELDNLLSNTVGKDEEIFIIGGGQIYKLFIDKADKLYITHVDALFPEADTFFPTIEESRWQKIREEKHFPDEKNIYPYFFTEYIKK
jgi:dihydrofolate reductase